MAHAGLTLRVVIILARTPNIVVFGHVAYG